MISKIPLTAEQMARSRRFYNLFSFVNGFSYMCLGETVVILLAVTLNAPDYVVSTLGAMIYFGFLLLPLGKFMTSRVGAAKSQADFWVLRNVAALCVGSASFAALLYKPLAIAFLLVGTFVFYGFRAAGVVMSQPLIGEICEPEKRAGLIAFSNGIFYVTGVVSLVIIFVLLHIHTSVWMLTGIIYAGAVLGVTASSFVRKIDETEALRESAKKPLLPEWKTDIANKALRRLFPAGFVVNLSIIMLGPVSMLALKRGYAVSDTDALFYSMIQFSGAIIGSFASGFLSRKFGPRRAIIWAYLLYLTICLVWAVVPVQLPVFLMGIPFLLCGGCAISMTNSMAHYYLMAVKPENRVSASMFIAIIAGAGAGVAGMVIAGALLKGTAILNAGGIPLDTYRLYFIITGILLGIAAFFVLRLVTVINDFRKTEGEHKVREVVSRDIRHNL